MNNTTPIKILTAAVLLTFGFALTANAALINKGVTEMNHEYTVSDTLSARQQAIPLIAVSMASSQMDKLNFLPEAPSSPPREHLTRKSRWTLQVKLIMAIMRRCSIKYRRIRINIP